MRVRNPLVSEGLNQLVLKMLAKDPEDRPVNMGVVLDALSQMEAYEADAEHLEERERWHRAYPAET